VDFRSPTGHPSPGLVTDAVTLRGTDVLLVRRGREPWKGMWALPGGFVEVGERPEDACLRELREETGVEGAIVALLGVYGDPARDPRGHVVAIAYVCEARGRATPSAGDDADAARWWPLSALPSLAADHAQILGDARASSSPWAGPSSRDGVERRAEDD